MILLSFMVLLYLIKVAQNVKFAKREGKRYRTN